MRLFEITRPAMYLGLARASALGTVMQRQGSVYPLGAMLENRLEERRPPDCLPRNSSFFLMLEPPAAAEHIYEVEPVGQLDRHHTGWLRLLAGATPTNVGEVDQYATGYWSGKEVPELRDEPWECRALKVKLLKRVGGQHRS